MEPQHRPITKKLRKKIHHYIFTVAYRDHILCETASRCNREDIEAEFKVDLEGVLVGDLPDVEKGEIFMDSRGRGSFQ